MNVVLFLLFTQLDIVAEFEVGKEALEGTVEADVGYNCSTSGGAAGRGALGPFGLLVLADDGLSEQTAVYFYIARKTDGALGTFICQDELRCVPISLSLSLAGPNPPSSSTSLPKRSESANLQVVQSRRSRQAGLRERSPRPGRREARRQNPGKPATTVLEKLYNPEVLLRPHPGLPWFLLLPPLVSQVDHSIVETFAQGGRTCITSRVYPTEAIYGAARVFLFNNATAGAVTAATVKIWQLSPAFIRPYTPSDGL